MHGAVEPVPQGHVSNEFKDVSGIVSPIHRTSTRKSSGASRTKSSGIRDLGRLGSRPSSGNETFLSMLCSSASSTCLDRGATQKGVLCSCTMSTSSDSSDTALASDRSSSCLTKHTARLQPLHECFDECSPPKHLSFIPVFTNLRAQRQDTALAHTKLDCLGLGGASTSAGCEATHKEGDAASAGAASSQGVAKTLQQQMGVSALSHSYQQDSLQLALEHSSADWQPQPLDTLVAVMGAPPGWMCGVDCSFDFWGGGSSRLIPTPDTSGLPAQLAALPDPQACARAPKLCVTVSTVSSEIDSLAFPPLRMPAPAPAQAAARVDAVATGLSSSSHLGEF